jgi:hypothetical protein
MFGIWFLNWKLSDIFILYWAESLIIGFYWFAKLVTIFIIDKNRREWRSKFVNTFFFFLFHFGIFMFAHLLMMMSFIVFHGDPADLDLMFSTARDALASLIVPLTFLFISHSFSFIQNFIIGKEYEVWLKKRSEVQSALPYGRIAVMHISVFLIAALVNAGKYIAPFSSILIIITKIITDLRGHRIEHNKTAA